jgi:hypothetical protein
MLDFQTHRHAAEAGEPFALHAAGSGAFNMYKFRSSLRLVYFVYVFWTPFRVSLLVSSCPPVDRGTQYYGIVRSPHLIFTIEGRVSFIIHRYRLRARID